MFKSWRVEWWYESKQSISSDLFLLGFRTQRKCFWWKHLLLLWMKSSCGFEDVRAWTRHFLTWDLFIQPSRLGVRNNCHVTNQESQARKSEICFGQGHKLLRSRAGIEAWVFSVERHWLACYTVASLVELSRGEDCISVELIMAIISGQCFNAVGPSSQQSFWKDRLDLLIVKSRKLYFFPLNSWTSFWPVFTLVNKQNKQKDI